MLSKPIKKFILNIANEQGLPANVVEMAVRSQFEYLAKYMKEGDVNPVRLIKLGVFDAKTRFKKYSNITEYFRKHGSNKKKSDKPIRLY